MKNSRKRGRWTVKKYTWDEIYERADGRCFGENNLKAKDNARENVRCLAIEYG